jgi:hypothetical protein
MGTSLTHSYESTIIAVDPITMYLVKNCSLAVYVLPWDLSMASIQHLVHTLSQKVEITEKSVSPRSRHQPCKYHYELVTRLRNRACRAEYLRYTFLRSPRWIFFLIFNILCAGKRHSTRMDVRHAHQVLLSGIIGSPAAAAGPLSVGRAAET